jgi:hypothetical protein
MPLIRGAGTYDTRTPILSSRQKVQISRGQWGPILKAVLAEHQQKLGLLAEKHG